MWRISYSRMGTGQGVRRPELQPSTVPSPVTWRKSPEPAFTSIKQGPLSFLTVCGLMWLIGKTVISLAETETERPHKGPRGAV